MQSTAFDMGLVQCGARLRRSPYYEAEQRYGPLGYTVYNHMLFPIRFDDFDAEYWHLLNHVTRVGRRRGALPRDLRARTASGSHSCSRRATSRNARWARPSTCSCVRRTAAS